MLLNIFFLFGTFFLLKEAIDDIKKGKTNRAVFKFIVSIMMIFFIVT